MDLLAPTRDSVEDLAVLTPGYYKIIFQTKVYFDATNRECFYPWVEVRDRQIWLLLSFLTLSSGHLQCY